MAGPVVGRDVLRLSGGVAGDEHDVADLLAANRGGVILQEANLSHSGANLRTRLAQVSAARRTPARYISRVSRSEPAIDAYSSTRSTDRQFCVRAEQARHLACQPLPTAARRSRDTLAGARR
jgi:hypothetical protein